ncbi:MAG: NAD(P)H-quinone oxidoreductase [Verrucomicrobia bacterium]|nr:NAD(P)H-quinone oxidoreductase [Verrucomicrobiota bacterium]
MRYIECKSPGPPDVMFVNEGPVPQLGSNEILIQVKAAGVNRPDLYQREGHYPPPAGASPIMGLEVAGIVAQVGHEVANWKVGDAVCALSNGGGYAEYCAVPAGQCLPLPKGLDFVDAASIPEAYFTVWGNLFMRGRFKSGESILVHGGSSGIGSCAIQLAKAFGGHVATTVGNADKMAFCKSLMADEIINYKEQDFFAVLKNKGVDLVLDIVGGQYFEKNFLLLKEEGRLIQVARMRGGEAVLDLSRLMFKRLTVLGSTLRAQSSEAKAKIAQELLSRVWPLFEKRTLKTVVTATFPLANAPDAHKLMESSQHCGKIVLTVES